MSKRNSVKKFAGEFKEFIMRGNVMDLAVAVVVGGAFNKIVTSLVADIIMPLIGLLTGSVNISELKVVFSAAVGDAPEVALRYGAFLQSVVDFLIIALSIFVAIRIFSSLAKRRKREEAQAQAAAPEAPPEPPRQEVLLQEIRDLIDRVARRL